MLAQFDNPGAFAKSFSELRKEFSGTTGRVKLPSPEADDAAWALFEEKLPDRYHRASRPEDYQAALAAPLDAEGEAVMQRFRDAMFAAGLPKAAFGPVVDWYMQEQKAQAETHEAQQLDRARQAMDTLKRDWGSAYDTNWALAKRAVSALFGDHALLSKRIAGGVEIGNDPAFLRAFAKAGALMGEDQLRAGGGGGGGATLAEDIQQMEADARAGGYYHDNGFQEKLQAKYRALHGARSAAGGVV